MLFSIIGFFRPSDRNNVLHFLSSYLTEITLKIQLVRDISINATNSTFIWNKQIWQGALEFYTVYINDNALTFHNRNQMRARLCVCLLQNLIAFLQNGTLLDMTIVESFGCNNWILSSNCVSIQGDPYTVHSKQTRVMKKPKLVFFFCPQYKTTSGLLISQIELVYFNPTLLMAHECQKV